MMASPIPITQFKVNSFTANVAHRCGWLPFINDTDIFDAFGSLPFDLLREFAEGYIRDFATPEAFHALKVQVFKEQPIKLAHEFQSQFPVVVSSLPFNLSVGSREIGPCLFSVVRTEVPSLIRAAIP